MYKTQDDRSLKLSPLVWVLIAVLLILVLTYLFVKEPFNSTSNKISELRSKIDEDVAKLKLARETERILINKAHQIFRNITIGLILFFVGINSGLVYYGFGFIEALEGTTLLVTFIGTACSLFIFNKISVNSLLEMAEKEVILWVYKRNSFEPETILIIEEQITRQRNLLTKMEINDREIAMKDDKA